ncbi:amine oxidase [Plakobranchus ocellatus]|uniref:Amine oxidase n=1 Tax=Plakobranchus ocellatus TaxID=259542 RepID=A0AAV4ARI0_9GAST|nr:amine oxidase [Plakobranchus ocellatus]
MKEALGMSWRQEKKHGKLLKKVGIHLDSEKSVELSRKIVSDFVPVEGRSFIKEDDSEYTAPYGRIAGLTKFVDHLLDSYKENNLLSWHNDSIPKDEVWVKIGGNHGKNSLKFTLQIANTEKPNARLNTIMIAIAAVRHTHANIVRFLEGGLGDDLVALQSHSWKGKAIKVFLNGDYDFLCKIYGLSGPQGTYPCLWCLMLRRDMHNPSNHCEHRSLESLLADNKMFMQQTDGEKKQANKFYNSLHVPLDGIELDKVSPPYLHILLGLVLKHHKLLKDAAHKLDKKVACQPDDFLLPLGKLLKRYGSQWGRAYELQERLLYEEGCLGFSELSDSQEQIDKYTQLHKTEQLISFLMHKELQPRIGPIASSLDTVLTKCRITPQAYHSRSFVGNHCHKYIQSAVYTDLNQIIVTKTQQCISNPMIIDEACTLQLIFDNLNNTFSTVHRAISHTKPIAPSSLPEIEIAIDTYMATYRRMFPRKIIPKQHLLEKHCIPHIKQHLFGLGLLEEQGTENSHQMIGLLETRARGIKNDMCKLKFILSSHLLQVAPALRDSV